MSYTDRREHEDHADEAPEGGAVCLIAALVLTSVLSLLIWFFGGEWPR